jgi:hypothetical protein
MRTILVRLYRSLYKLLEEFATCYITVVFVTATSQNKRIWYLEDSSSYEIPLLQLRQSVDKVIASDGGGGRI